MPICTNCGVCTKNPNHTCNPIDIEQLENDLLAAFGSDVNVLPYYTVIKDLSASGNWTAMSQILIVLLGANKITQDEINILKNILANQGITLP